MAYQAAKQSWLISTNNCQPSPSNLLSTNHTSFHQPYIVTSMTVGHHCYQPSWTNHRPVLTSTSTSVICTQLTSQAAFSSNGSQDDHGRPKSGAGAVPDADAPWSGFGVVTHLPDGKNQQLRGWNVAVVDGLEDSCCHQWWPWSFNSWRSDWFTSYCMVSWLVFGYD